MSNKKDVTDPKCRFLQLKEVLHTYEGQDIIVDLHSNVAEQLKYFKDFEYWCESEKIIFSSRNHEDYLYIYCDGINSWFCDDVIKNINILMMNGLEIDVAYL